MSYYLLDGVGGAFLIVLFGLGLLFIVIAILLEAAILQWMKYIQTYKTALVHSLTVNLVSLAAGFILSFSDNSFLNLGDLRGFAIFFLVTYVVELGVLYLMNKTQPLRRTALVCLVMNALTYLLAYLLILVL